MGQIRRMARPTMREFMSRVPEEATLANAALKRLGVQHGQGFLFSKAVPAAEVEALAATAAMTPT